MYFVFFWLLSPDLQKQFPTSTSLAIYWVFNKSMSEKLWVSITFCVTVTNDAIFGLRVCWKVLELELSFHVCRLIYLLSMDEIADSYSILAMRPINHVIIDGQLLPAESYMLDQDQLSHHSTLGWFRWELVIFPKRLCHHLSAHDESYFWWRYVATIGCFYYAYYAFNIFSFTWFPFFFCIYCSLYLHGAVIDLFVW